MIWEIIIKQLTGILLGGEASLLLLTVNNQHAIVCRKLNIDIMEWIRPTNVGCYILSILCFISDFLRPNNDHIIGVAILNCYMILWNGYFS